MSILSRVKKAKSNAGPALDTVSKYAKAGATLFGKKERVVVPQHNEDLEEENINFDNDYESSIENDEHSYQESNQRTNHDTHQMGRMRDYLRDNNIDTSSEFNRDTSTEYSDERLRSMARLKVRKLYLSADLKTEPLRIAAAYAFKKMGKDKIAEELKSTDLNEGFEDFKEMLEEVIYYELKDLQRANKLRMPSAAELMQFKIMASFEKIAGEGFKNVIELGEAGYQKVSKKKK